MSLKSITGSSLKGGNMSFSLLKTGEKVVRGIIAGGVAIACSALAKYLEVDITADQQLVLVAVLFGVLAGITNFLKHKFPKIFGWL
jgi:hypothetical protein